MGSGELAQLLKEQELEALESIIFKSRTRRTSLRRRIVDIDRSYIDWNVLKVYKYYSQEGSVLQELKYIASVKGA